MADAYFAPLGIGRFVATDSTGGPWDPALQHGGPPSALLVRAAEQLARTSTGRHDLVALRYAAEFIGPVPVGEVAVEAQIVRAARSAVLASATLRGLDRPCLTARVWLVGAVDTAAVAHADLALPLPADGGRMPGWSFPYGESIDWRREPGARTGLGPRSTWARPRLPLVAGEPMSGLQRAVLVGDSASGVSAELDWDEWSFLNVDLDVHLARPVRGDWIRIDAATQLGPQGSALTRSTLADAAGIVGATAQTLVLAPRRLSSR